MAKLRLIKNISGVLVPASEEDAERLKRWKAGDILSAEIKKPRNAAFHRKFFALFNIVYENQEKYINKKDLMTELKISVGHYEEFIRGSGKLVYIPRSISFGSMDDIEFGEFYSKVLSVVLREFMPGSTEAEINNAVSQRLEFL